MAIELPFHTNVLLSSGGMDSYLLACLPALRDNAVHVFVNMCQPYWQKEQRSALRTAQQTGGQFIRVHTTRLDQFEDRKTGIIPFRNAMLLLNAAQYGDRIHFGVLHGETVGDKSVSFFRSLENAMNMSLTGTVRSESDMRIVTPFSKKTKADCIVDYLRDGGELAPLLATVSCYSELDGESQHCGTCPSCFKRWVALTCALAVDVCTRYPKHFLHHPAQWQTRAYWQTLCKLKYSKQRAAETIRALDLAETHA